MDDNKIEFPMHVGILVMNAAELRAVYAVLAGTALATGNAAAPAPAPVPVTTGASDALTPVAAADTNSGAPASISTDEDNGQIDAHGHPWSAELHASTKTLTKDGLWRMKPGVSRPDPKPGFPADNGTGTGTSPSTGEGTNSATSQDAPKQPQIGQAVTAEEDDEFAAFRAAAAQSEATDASAAASVPARQFTDADLGTLCNQAAHKLGTPDPIKEEIARFVPEGQVVHSRSIPEDRRAEFVKVIEEKAGIQFAG